MEAGRQEDQALIRGIELPVQFPASGEGKGAGA